MSRQVHRSALVGVPIDTMFETIDRVEDYPQFLPWCVATSNFERGVDFVAATVEVGWKHLHFKVRTRNPKTTPTRMEIHLEDGSFRHFRGLWELKPLGERGCRVDFSLDYELALPGAERVAGSIIDHAADRMVDAFLERAESAAAPVPSAPPSCHDALPLPPISVNPDPTETTSTPLANKRF